MSEEKKTTGKAKTPSVTKEPETVVYIGPDIPGAKQYTVYNAGLPDALKEKMEKYPFFRSLVVPVEKLAAAGVELKKEGSALNVLYRKAIGK